MDALSNAWAFVNVWGGTLAGVALIVAGAFAWFRVPVFGKYVGLGLIVGGCWVLAEARGYARARDACKEAALRIELANVRADLNNAEYAAERAGELKIRLDLAERKNQELAHAIELDAVKTPPPAACLLDRRSADRLRAIK